MGFTKLTLQIPTDYSEQTLRKVIMKKLRIVNFTYQIESKSLDARNKRKIHWVLNVAVHSEELKGTDEVQKQQLEIPYKKRNKKVMIVGSGPAGIFAAIVLQKAGFETTLIERGSDVSIREKSIRDFESGGTFPTQNNYAFGEGGAGTFSDGKLTSRSKHISLERQFILDQYIEAGAPPEIAYMTHPHLGTDNLKKIVVNMRNSLVESGGRFMFDTTLQDISIEKGKIVGVKTSNGDYETDALFIAPGHSAFETYRMLMKRGVQFRTKNFAIGARMEHPQELINRAQWGTSKLAGVKAAEYRLTSQANGKHSVYSFCMCPGGMVVPAAAYADTNIVNGMSYYLRDGRYANAACVAGIHPDELAKRQVTPLEALDFVESLERTFFDLAKNYSAPACTIASFLNKKVTGQPRETSYPLGLESAELWNLLPRQVSDSMREGLKDFSRKIAGFEQGNLIGLESKTSSSIQVLREQNGACTGFNNLFLIGEGSGYAGGIVSSAADGVKVAMGFVMSFDL